MVEVFLLAFSVIFFINLFNPGPAAGDENTSSVDPTISDWAGSIETVEKLGDAKMPELSGKIGHEQHFGYSKCFKSGESHQTNKYSKPLASVPNGNCGAYGGGKTADQEMWYFNMRWFTASGYPGNIKHKKVIVTNPKNGKMVVVSVEEYGPAAYLKTRDGIVAGASPEVYNYLKLANPYTGDPDDKKGFATFGLAKDQDIPLGPLN
jgi:hypothetical protein